MPGSERKQSRKGWSTFSMERKVAFVIFSVTGILGLGLSVVHMGQQIKAPFILSYDGEKFESYDERALREIKEQKEKDTDGDGINDYDELNVYRTSPYLADSDSDGFSDGQEIKSGDDPNCPVGQDCGRAAEGSVNSPLVAADIRDKLPFEEVGLSVEINDETDIQSLLTALSSDDIRAALVAEGIEQATVDALTDDEVLVLFDEALKSLEQSGALDSILSQ